jgi:hypothetical protein
MRLSIHLLLPLVLAAPLSAQIPAHEWNGSAAGDNFGRRVVRIGDLDGGGKDDLLVSAPRANFNGVNSGSVYAFSSATGAEIYRMDGASNGDLFGDALDRIGDVSGDGIDDWVVGSPFSSAGSTRSGQVELRSGSDGAQLLVEFGNEAFASLGTSVAGLGDVNGDLVPDFVASAPFEDSNGQDAGVVYVFSGANLAQIRQHFGQAAGDRLGLAVVNCGDADGDTRDDYAIGTTFTNGGLGTVEARSGFTGAPIQSFLGTSQTGTIGLVLGRLADMNGDGRSELAIAAPDDSTAGTPTGAVYVHSIQSAATIQSNFGLSGQTLGLAVADAGDWDGDGQADWLVGRQDALGNGGVVIYSGVDGSTLTEQVAGVTNDLLGSALAGGFDLDGDLRAEYVVGDASANPAGNDSGSAMMMSAVSHLGTPMCLGDGSGNGCPCGNISTEPEGCTNSTGGGALLTASGSASASADDLMLHVSGAAPNKPSLLFAGTQTVNGGNGSNLGDGLLCAGGMITRISVRISSATGDADWGPGILGAQGWGAGLDRQFQVWYRDTSGGPCGSQSNLSNGLLLHVTL